MQAGDVLPIVLQLPDGDPTKFVRVRVLTSNGLNVVGSPAILPHRNEGLYSTSSFLMPLGFPFVTAQYEIIDDAALTSPSYEYNLVESDVFVLSQAPITAAQIAATIWAASSRTLTSGGGITATQLEEVQENILEAIGSAGTGSGTGGGGVPVYEARMSFAINAGSNSAEVLTWLTKNGGIVTDADSAEVTIEDGLGNTVLYLGIDLSDTIDGVFRFIATGITSTLVASKAYVAKVSIARGVSHYTSLVPFTLGSQVAAGSTTPPTTDPTTTAPNYNQDQPEKDLGFPQIFGVRADFDDTLDKMRGVF